MSSTWHIPRRTFLRGVGTAIALPALECMTPGLAFSAGNERKPPLRMAFLYVPNGAHMEDWTPEKEGDYDLPEILKPLADYKRDMLVLTNLTLDKARANGDGPGDHARSMASFLTGCQAKKTHGADISVGISVDQVAADKVGRETKFPSLQIGCEKGRQSGNCDSGYSCAYSSSMSWRTATSPLGKEVNPRNVFDRLFGTGNSGESAESRKKRELYKKSILDLVAEDTKSLSNQLGAKDKRKLDEYLYAVREIEQRIAKSGEAGPKVDFARPDGIPKDLGEHIRLLGDLMVLAFQGDVTRVCTFAFANEGSNRSYKHEINVPEGHHDLSHHGKNADKQAKIKQINLYHMQQFAYILSRLKNTKESDGKSLLDHSMIVYGSGIGDGNRHNHDHLPVLLLGHGGGSLKPGRHVKYEPETPLVNLYLSMLDRIGAPIDSLGDSTGRLANLV